MFLDLSYRFHRRQVRWSGILISLRIFHSLLWSLQSKALFILVNEVKVDVYLKFPCFFMIHWMLAIWCLVPLLFLNLACTSRCYQFIHCWILDPVLLILEGRSTYVLLHNEELSPDRDVSLSYSKGLLFLFIYLLWVLIFQFLFWHYKGCLPYC